jgi:hypothetical protein
MKNAKHILVFFKLCVWQDCRCRTDFTPVSSAVLHGRLWHGSLGQTASEKIHSG